MLSSCLSLIIIIFAWNRFLSNAFVVPYKWWNDYLGYVGVYSQKFFCKITLEAISTPKLDSWTKLSVGNIILKLLVIVSSSFYGLHTGWISWWNLASHSGSTLPKLEVWYVIILSCINLSSFTFLELFLLCINGLVWLKF